MLRYGHSKRFTTFQVYLSRCFWVAGGKSRNWDTVYDEERKRKISKFALSATYLTSLPDILQCLLENSYSASNSKLNEVKPGIKLKIENQKKIDASNRAISRKDNKVSKTPCICGGGSGGGINSKHYRDCETCRQLYPGEYHLIGIGGGNCDDHKKGKFVDKNNAKQYMNKMYAKQQHGHDDSDLDSNEEKLQRSRLD